VLKPALILLGSGDREYRGYMVESIARRYRLILLSTRPPTWERPYLADHAEVDPSNVPAVRAAAATMARRHDVAGLLTYHEPCVELAASIGRELGLPGCDPEAARRCRDKYAARRAFERAGVPSARCRLVHSRAEATAAAAGLGFPAVVKPRALCASFGVSRVDGPEGVAAAYDCAESSALPEAWSTRDGVLVEEYLDGPEISVDSVVHDGIVEPIVYARKLLGPPPFFEEVGHIVAPPEQVADDPGEVLAVVRAAHAALGVDRASTHTELRLTPTGPRVIEVNGRSGGDLIPYLATLASGADLALAAADVAAGGAPRLSPARSGAAGIRFFYPASAGRLAAATSMHRSGRPPWLHRLTWLIEPGAELRPRAGSLYYSRVGFGIVTAETAEECADRLSAVDQGITLDLRPPPAS
jgi:biotin carboxylase